LGEVQAAVLDRLDRRHQRELREAVQVARGLSVQDGFGVEALHLAAEVDLERRGVELLDPADAAPAGAEGLPVAAHAPAQGVDRAQAVDDNAAPGHFLANSRSM